MTRNPPVRTSAKPRIMKLEASVPMKELMRPTVTRRPLPRPNARPTQRRLPGSRVGRRGVGDLGGSDARDRVDRTDREVEAAGDDDEGGGTRHDPDRRPLVQDVREVRPRQEDIRGDRERDEQGDEADDEAVVAATDASSTPSHGRPSRPSARFLRSLMPVPDVGSSPKAARMTSSSRRGATVELARRCAPRA